MAASNIDSYLADLDEPKRGTLGQLRCDIVAAVPDAEECISYGLPAYRVHGRIVAGFAAFKDHLSLLPHSGSVLAASNPTSRTTSTPRARCTSPSSGRCHHR